MSSVAFLPNTTSCEYGRPTLRDLVDVLSIVEDVAPRHPIIQVIIGNDFHVSVLSPICSLIGKLLVLYNNHSRSTHRRVLRYPRGRSTLVGQREGPERKRGDSSAHVRDGQLNTALTLCITIPVCLVNLVVQSPNRSY